MTKAESLFDELRKECKDCPDCDWIDDNEVVCCEKHQSQISIPAPEAEPVERLAEGAAKRVLNHCEVQKWRLSATLIDHPQARAETLSDIAVIIGEVLASAIRKGQGKSETVDVEKVAKHLTEVFYRFEAKADERANCSCCRAGVCSAHQPLIGVIKYHLAVALGKVAQPQPAPVQSIDEICKEAVEALAKLPPDEHGKCDCEFCTRQRQSILRSAIEQATRPKDELLNEAVRVLELVVKEGFELARHDYRAFMTRLDEEKP